MEEKQERLYEGMYILSAHLSEEARVRAFEAIQERIKSRGGEIKKIHDFGRRRLAYEIERHREGYYYIMYFTIGTECIGELWEEYRRNENLLRFLTIKAEAVVDAITFKSLPDHN